jgi:hypothetical protein
MPGMLDVDVIVRDHQKVQKLNLHFLKKLLFVRAGLSQFKF